MRSLTEYLEINTKKAREYENITSRVAGAVERSGVKEGLCLVSAMHITAGIYINDDEPGFRADLDELLDRLAPEGLEYRHHETGETNGDAHQNKMLIGSQVTLPITKAALDLGPWQQIFYAEFDGRRRKRIVIKVIGE
jgi:secondary thiamine-phosphate synthase enzyme